MICSYVTEPLSMNLYLELEKYTGVALLLGDFLIYHAYKSS